MDYDQITGQYAQYGESVITYWILGYANVIKLISPLKNKIVLDYGCGNGKFSRHLIHKCKKVIGVDTSFQMITEAKIGEPQNIDYHRIESGRLDFIQSNSVDAVVVNFVTCTISSQKEILDIFLSLERVLKPNGRLVLLNANWNEANGKDFISFKLIFSPNLSSGHKIYVDLKSADIRIEDYFWTREDYISLIYEAKLKLESIQTPLATDDNYPWIDEREFAPFELICARKGVRRKAKRNLYNLSTD